VSAVHPLVFFL